MDRRRKPIMIGSVSRSGKAARGQKGDGRCRRLKAIAIGITARMYMSQFGRVGVMRMRCTSSIFQLDARVDVLSVNTPPAGQERAVLVEGCRAPDRATADGRDLCQPGRRQVPRVLVPARPGGSVLDAVQAGHQQRSEAQVRVHQADPGKRASMRRPSGLRRTGYGSRPSGSRRVGQHRRCSPGPDACSCWCRGSSRR